MIQGASHDLGERCDCPLDVVGSYADIGYVNFAGCDCIGNSLLSPTHERSKVRQRR